MEHSSLSLAKTREALPNRITELRLPYRALFYVAPTEWRKPCGGLQMTWKRVMEKMHNEDW